MTESHERDGAEERWRERADEIASLPEAERFSAILEALRAEWERGWAASDREWRRVARTED